MVSARTRRLREQRAAERAADRAARQDPTPTERAPIVLGGAPAPSTAPRLFSFRGLSALVRGRQVSVRGRTIRTGLGEREDILLGIIPLGIGGTGVFPSVVPLIPKTVPGVVGAVTGAGILTSSPSAREFVGGVIKDPLKLGREAGLLIEKAVAGEDIPFGEAAKVAGIAGLTVAAVVGGKKVIEKFKDRKTIDQIPGPSGVPTSIALPTDRVPDVFAPLSEGPVVEETPEAVVPGAGATDINIKVINKPQINVAVAQSS